jgi:hypothetical protein
MTDQIVRDIDMWVEKYQPHTSSERKKGIRRPHAGALLEKEAAFIMERTHEAYRLSPNALFYLLYKLPRTPSRRGPCVPHAALLLRLLASMSMNY